MKICFVTEHFPPHIGGVEIMFKEYSVRLARLGCEVTVLTSNSGGLTGTAVEDGVEIHRLAWRNVFGHPVPDKQGLRPFIEACDIVHTTTYTAAPAALAVAQKFHKPCVITAHEVLGKRWYWVEANPLKAALFYTFEQYVIRKTYALYHAVSLATQEDLRRLGIPDNKLITIHHGVERKPAPGKRVGDWRAEFGFDAKTKIFLYYGRPGKTKGIFILLEAIERLKEKLPQEVRFVFVLGKEPRDERAAFLRRVEAGQLHRLITVVDPLSDADLTQAISDAYCVIIPSVTEGFGFTAAEACSLGSPVIASNAGSLPEVVSGKVLFFQNRDSKDLAANILRAVEDKFTLVAPKIFDWDASTRQLYRAYERLLGSASRAGED